MEPSTAENPKSVRRRDALKNLLFVFIVIGAAYVVTRYVGLEQIDTFVAQAGWWGPVALVALKMTTIIIVPLGGGPLYPVAGAVFGFWKGLALTFLGDLLGFSVAFLLSRFFGRPVAYALIPRVHIPHLERVLAQASVTRSFIKARLAFLGFPELFAYGAGLTSVSFPLFLSVQLLPHTPATIPFVFFGDALLRFTDTPYALAAIIAVTILVAGGFGWWFSRDFVRTA